MFFIGPQTVFGDDDLEGDKNTKDTSVVFFQSSPLSQSFWQPTTVITSEDGSPAASPCGTPTLQRRSFKQDSNSHQGSVKKNKNGYKSALTIPKISCEVRKEEKGGKVDKSSLPSSPKNFSVLSPAGDEEISRSKSLFNFPSLKRKKSPDVMKEPPPNLIITPSSSHEKLQKIKSKFTLKPFSPTNKEIVVKLDDLSSNNNPDSDEYTPLVESSVNNSDSDRCLYLNVDETRFNKVNFNTNDSISASLPSIPETVSKEDGLDGNTPVLTQSHSISEHPSSKSQNQRSKSLVNDIPLNVSVPVESKMEPGNSKKERNASDNHL